MKYYKGFDKNLQCRGFQYEVGKEYETDAAELCKRGFHACEVPLDVFDYYPPADSRYCEVELDNVAAKNADSKDSKVAAKRIKIGAEIGIAGLVKAHIDYVREHTTTERTAGFRGAATAGFRGAATAGFSGAATAGVYGAATAGAYGAATAGFRGAATAGFSGAATAGAYGAATAGAYGAATAGACGAATAGDRGAATAGDRGAATAGAYGAATAGAYGAATAGDRGAATSRGTASVGKNGIACVRGNGCRVRGGIGAVLVAVEEQKNNYDIRDWKATFVDGKKIKPDTWYQLENGEFVEAPDQSEA